MSDDNTEKDTKKPNAILKFASHPAVGVAVGVLGIVIGFYLYWSSREIPELTYYVHPVKAAVVRTGQISRLSVQFDGKDLNSNVTAAQVAFWNAGRRAIRRSAILEPLVMRTADKARILEVRLPGPRNLGGTTRHRTP